MDKSAIILAGGFSSRFGQDKGLVKLAGKPLINHVLDAVGNIVQEKMVIVSSKVQAEIFAKVVNSHVNVCIDNVNLRSPLVGTLTGLEKAHGEYALILACDTPLVSKDVLVLLFELCLGKNAVIPRWPNGYVEPLHAVYRTKLALTAARNALEEGKLNMRALVERLRGVRYVSTLVLQQLDPDLRTFLNINTPLDLKRAELMLKGRKAMSN